MSRRGGRAAALLAAMVLFSAPATAASARLALDLSFLAVGDNSRVVATQRVVLDVGMATVLSLPVPRQATTAGVALCTLRLGTAAGNESELLLDMHIEVAHPQVAAPWQRQVRARLWPGTSTLVEVAPEDDTGERLVLSVTVEEAPGEEITAAAPAIEIEVRVEGMAGTESIMLQNPRLRTFAGQTAEFFFDYVVPAAAGGADHVRFDLRLSPGFPRAGRLPLRLELAGRVPGGDGPILYSRDQETSLASGEPWEHRFAPPGTDESLRLTILPAWRPF